MLVMVKFQKITTLYSVSFKRGQGSSFQGGFGTLARAKKFAETKKTAIIHKSILALIK